MFYGVVAPGIATVYRDWKSVERIKALYPYPKFAKFDYESDAMDWVKRNKYKDGKVSVFNYGSTLRDKYISARYKICPDCVLYLLDCKLVGRMRVNVPDALVEYKGDKIQICVNNLQLSNETIAGHMSAIYNLLSIVGPYVDVNLRLDYYSLFYCLTNYNRENNRYVSTVRSAIDSRMGEVAVSYDFLNMLGEEV